MRGASGQWRLRPPLIVRSTQRRTRWSSTESRCRLVFWPEASPLRRPVTLNVERPLLGAANDRSGSILLKNSVSAGGRKISRDMARFDREVPRGYRPKAFASPESSLFGSMQTYRQFSLATSSWRKNARTEKPSFSTE